MVLKRILKISIIMFALMFPLNVIANPAEGSSLTNEYDLGVEECAEVRSSDHIEYHYRILNGVVQYRRWNATRGYWIDATWLDMP